MTDAQAPPAKLESLQAAAAAIEEELARFEQLARAVTRLELNSEKSLTRAGRALVEAVECHERIVHKLKGLGAAVAQAQERQQVATQSIEASAREVQRRTAEFTELGTGLAALGEEAHAITILLQDLSPTPGNDEATAPEFSTRLTHVIERMDQAVERARALHRRALQSDLQDVARQADSLSQKLDAARNRLKLPLKPPPQA
jgi:chromosome segregation ATPase